MTKLVFGHDERVAEWVRVRIPDVTTFGPCRAIGVASPSRQKLWAGVVYNDFHPELGVCSISIASDYPRWVTREMLRRLLSVPFLQYNCRKLYVTVASDNARSLKFARGLHFCHEATLRHHYGRKRHALVLSMMRAEFDRWWSEPRMKEAA